ncbi:MAG TPA: site-specific integrase [Steroidobacteraceae bacterium]|nr:site-specific integrase [Steroidobacteraceae bacterium]
MATITEKRNDDGTRSFVVQIRVKGLKSISQTFCDSKYESRKEARKAAEAWGKRQEQELRDLSKRDGVRADVATMKFEELVIEYLKDPETKALATAGERERQLAWWVNQFGGVKALEFANALRIRAAREQLLRKYDAATVNRYLAAARACVNFGRTSGLVPADRVIWPPGLMLTEPKARERFLSDAELDRVLMAAREESELMHAAVVFAIGVGCRQSEQLRVRWGDIDEADGTVAVRVTKTDTSRRAHLPPAVVTALTALKALRTSTNVRPMPSRLVFADAEGQAIPQYVLIDAWQRIRKAAKVSDVRWHDLRHTTASYLIQNRATLAEVAAQLGHKNVATAKRYSHLVPGAKPTGADALNAKLSR